MKSDLPAHLRRLEAESIHIMREVVAEMSNPVMLYSIGKDFERHAACGDEGVPSGQTAVPAPARRYDLEIPGDDRVPRRDGAPARARTHRPCQRGRRPAGGFADRLRFAGAYPGDEDRSAAAGARQRRLRRGVRRRAAGRGKEPRQGAHLLPPLGDPRLGPAQPAPGTLAAVQHAHPRGRVDARLSAVQLDRTRRLGIRAGRGDSGRAALFLQGPARGRALRRADHGG